MTPQTEVLNSSHGPWRHGLDSVVVHDVDYRGHDGQPIVTFGLWADTLESGPSNPMKQGGSQKVPVGCLLRLIGSAWVVTEARQNPDYLAQVPGEVPAPGGPGMYLVSIELVETTTTNRIN
jgi:hypothetical protein